MCSNPAGYQYWEAVSSQASQQFSPLSGWLSRKNLGRCWVLLGAYTAMAAESSRAAWTGLSAPIIAEITAAPEAPAPRSSGMH